jgi:photosystem II stability/assembly factor-like uncharacterized protein
MKRILRMMLTILLIVLILQAGGPMQNQVNQVKADTVDNWVKLPLGDEWVTSIAIDPVNSEVIYVTTPTDGIWKTIDGGQHWFQIFYQKGTIFISIILDFQTHTIYVAAPVGLTPTGGGVWKSIDDGKNWRRVLQEHSIGCLRLDPLNSNVVYVPTARGIFKSIDGGENWKLISGIVCYELALDPQNSQIMYAGTLGQGVLKSIDGGENWVSLGDKTLIPKVDSILVDPSNTQTIYVSIGRTTTSPGKGVFKSIDGGKNWKPINNGLEILNMRGGMIYDNKNNIIYVGTMGLETNDGKGVFKSVNGGENWEAVGLEGLNISALALDPNNPEIIYVGTMGNGLFRINKVVITASVGLGGSISPSGTITVNYGDSKTFTITSDTGYKIKDVKVDGVSVGAVSTYIFINVTNNHTIEAIFEPITFTITTSTGLGGSISPSGTITVNYGDSKTFTITSDTGYKIKDVKVDGVSVGAVSTYPFTNITKDHTIEAIFEKKIVIILQVGKTSFIVNSTFHNLDSPPVIKNERTLLPIRAVIEALNGTVGWDATERKVTITLGSNTIELWIGKSTAKVNGINTPIDATNSKVVPEIINSRTMLPLRFVTENLGCQVQWDGVTQTITIIYSNNG